MVRNYTLELEYKRKAGDVDPDVRGLPPAIKKRMLVFDGRKAGWKNARVLYIWALCDAEGVININT